MDLSAGQIVADKYRIDGILGSGGMGVVVLATHLELDQKVAIKLLRDASTEGRARFHREARLLVRLKSPHVARVFDVGVLEDETPYIVMEHLEGRDLGKVLDEKKRLGVEEATDHVLQAMCAVAEAHALGMIHRDLKPANLFVARGPGGTTLVKVLDFGVSKIMEERVLGADLTNEGVALGSPGYMSPEQMTSSRDVDVRADIFALGAILYRFVSGVTPFKGTSIVSVLASMAVDPLRPLDTVARDVPPAFAAAVARCLAQDPNDRWPSVAPLADALEPFASRRGRAAIEQILATLQVAPRDSTEVMSGAPVSGAPSSPEVILASTRVLPLSPTVAASYPTTPSVPPPPPVTTPAATARGARSGTIALAATIFVAGGTLAAIVAAVAMRGSAPEGSSTAATAIPSAEPPPSSLSTALSAEAPQTSPSSAAASAVVITGDPIPSAPPSASAAPSASTSATSSSSSTKKGTTKPPRVVPHPPPSHATATTTPGGWTPPPNPNDVPPGRH